jgi:hypothetical protein
MERDLGDSGDGVAQSLREQGVGTRPALIVSSSEQRPKDDAAETHYQSNQSRRRIHERGV